MNSIIKFFIERFKEAGNNEAIIWKEKIYTYEWLVKQIEYWQEQLPNKGVKSGDIVILEADFSPNAMALFFALADSGVIIVPLTESVAHKRDEFIRIAEGELIIRLKKDDSVGFELLNNNATHELYNKLRDKGKSGLILFSSGSTGKSKATLHDLSVILQKFKKERPSRRTITFLLYDHIGGINTMLHTLSNKACIVTLNQRGPSYVLEMVAKHKVQVLPASPTFINLILISQAWQDYDLSSLELVTYGTEPMPESTLKRFHQALPHVKLLQTYGLSEVGILRSKSRSDDSLWVKIGGEGFETRIIDGLLEIRAHSAMLGYLNAPSPFTDDGWFKTGDEVEQDGEWLRILGRRSEIINVGGEKVFPAEIESVIQEMDGVVEATVFGEKHPIVGMIVCLKVKISTDENKKEFRNRMRKHCKSKLLPYQLPAKIIFTDDKQHGERFKKMRNI